MSVHIVDDEQRRDRRATPMRPSGSGLAGTSASLALLDDVHRHRLRRAASHLPPPGQERGTFYYSDRLLDHQERRIISDAKKPSHNCLLGYVRTIESRPVHFSMPGGYSGF